jgi:hypothetical protein
MHMKNTEVSAKRERDAVRRSSFFVEAEYARAVDSYRVSRRLMPLLLLGDAKVVLDQLPEASIDFAMTSPPYWGKREYEGGGIGLERSYQEFVCHLCNILLSLKHVLKPEGSFWLNIGDTYQKKGLVGIPWRVALELTDRQGWILRNSVIWNKVKSGMDNTKDRLGNVHEHVFHFVKQPKYYYDADAIRSKPREARVANGAVVSATGVSGVRYKRQIELSTSLSEEEKQAAFKALDQVLADVAAHLRFPHDYSRPTAYHPLGQRTGLRPRQGATRTRVLFSSIPSKWKQARRRMGHHARGHTEEECPLRALPSRSVPNSDPCNVPDGRNCS